MKKTILLSSSLLVLPILTACQSGSSLVAKIDNGSLDYQQAKQLDPLQLPAEQETASFTPLYPIPTVGENTLDLQNEQGTRYELPPPKRAVQP